MKNVEMKQERDRAEDGGTRLDRTRKRRDKSDHVQYQDGCTRARSETDIVLRPNLSERIQEAVGHPPKHHDGPRRIDTIHRRLMGGLYVNGTLPVRWRAGRTIIVTRSDRDRDHPSAR